MFSQDLLSLVGLVTKRRGDYFQQAEDLARKAKSPEKLEEMMTVEAKLIVSALKNKQIKWEEYERSLIDKTIINALASVHLGSKKAKPKDKMEKAWPIIVGDMLPPMKEFLEETKQAIDSDTIRVGDSTEEFREGVGSWLGLVSRVVRYIANPGYSFFNLGQFYVRQDQGYKEMRRVARQDNKTCPDCINFNSMGWQPLGSLPMPGRECQCYDRCRCSIEYR
jgi:hypothetical protein